MRYQLRQSLNLLLQQVTSQTRIIYCTFPIAYLITLSTRNGRDTRDMQRRTSSGARGSLFFQSKGMTGGDCLPTSGLFKEMQELASAKQNEGGMEANSSCPLSALLDSRRKAAISQQEASLLKVRPMPQKRLRDLPSPGQDQKLKRGPSDVRAIPKSLPPPELKKATTPNNKSTTRGNSSIIKKANPKQAPPLSNNVNNPISTTPTATSFCKHHINDIINTCRSVNYSPTVAITISSVDWCSELGGLCPTSKPDAITVSCTLFNRQTPVMCCHCKLDIVIQSLKTLICDQTITKITYNIQALYVVIAKYVLEKNEKPDNVCDVKTMMWMVNPSENIKHLSSINSAVVSYDDAKAVHVTVQTDNNSVRNRHCEIRELYEKLGSILDCNQLGYCMVKLEMPVAWVLAIVHVTGFPIDTTQLLNSKSRHEQLLHEIENDIMKYARPPFNALSHDDVRALLFDQLKLQDKCDFLNGTPISTNKTKKKGIFSTDKDTLQAMSTVHPAPNLIMKYRAVQKLLMTYIVNLTSHAKDGIIHPQFNQEGTDTGRLSCANPNLQNQPRKDHAHLDYSIVRLSFKPHSNDILVAVDYSQIEIRILAHMSKDSSLCNLLNGGGDLHKSIAATVFGKSVDQITPSERQVGKKVIFGIIYGQGQKALASTIGVSLSRASQLLQGFKKGFPGVQRWSEEVIRSCSRTGEVRTFANRLRKIKNISSSNSFERAAAIRQSINTIIQGSAADIIKMAMVNTQPVILEYSLRLVCQIHDEMIFSVPRSSFPQCIPHIEKAMETVTALAVPLKVSSAFGPTWGDLTDWMGSAEQQQLSNCTTH